MKILHCSDIHLGAPLTSLGENATPRRRELLENFCDLVSYAKNNADAMIVAGDLFDSNTVDGGIFAAVSDAFYDAKIPIFLLSGNHDGRLQKTVAKMPENVFTFDRHNKYDLNNKVTIFGVKSADAEIRFFDKNRYNILIMHGAKTEIDLSKYAGEPIDYLAMGHYHKYSAEPFARGFICYCGSNEPRDFGDVGQTGFIMLDTAKSGSNAITRLDFAKRHMVTKTLELAGINSVDALLKEYKNITADVGRENYLNLIVAGRRNPNVDMSYLTDKKDFFATRIDDQTTLDYDLEKLKTENSLAGEFIRTVVTSGADKKTASRAIELGLTALEEVR